MISDEAVEAAMRSIYSKPGVVTESDVRAALEAAAPHMQQEPSAASVWDEAANVLYMGNAINQDHLKAMWERNPYRSQP